MAEQDKEKPVLDTPELILKDAVLRSNKLDAEAQEAILQKGDTAIHRQKLIERAELIAGLPDRVRETVVRGQSFPEGDLNQLEILSELAKKVLREKNRRSLFALSSFLTPPNLLEGEPNLLEELVNELYPPKKVIK